MKRRTLLAAAIATPIVAVLPKPVASAIGAEVAHARLLLSKEFTNLYTAEELQAFLASRFEQIFVSLFSKEGARPVRGSMVLSPGIPTWNSLGYQNFYQAKMLAVRKPSWLRWIYSRRSA